MFKQTEPHENIHCYEQKFIDEVTNYLLSESKEIDKQDILEALYYPTPKKNIANLLNYVGVHTDIALEVQSSKSIVPLNTWLITNGKGPVTQTAEQIANYDKNLANKKKSEEAKKKIETYYFELYARHFLLNSGTNGEDIDNMFNKKDYVMMANALNSFGVPTDIAINSVFNHDHDAFYKWLQKESWNMPVISQINDKRYIPEEESITDMVKRKVIEKITNINHDKYLSSEVKKTKFKKLGNIFSKALELEKKQGFDKIAKKENTMLPMYNNQINRTNNEDIPIPFDVRVANHLNSKGIESSEALSSLENRELLSELLQKIGIRREDSRKIAIDRDEETFKKVQLEVNKVKLDV